MGNDSNLRRLYRTPEEIEEAYNRALWPRGVLKPREKSPAVELVEECERQQKYLATVGQVYFIQIPTGPIKIGFSIKAAARLRNLQVSSAYPLTLIGYVKGAMTIEQELHERFARYRMSGEWFKRSKILVRFADSLIDEQGTRLARFI